MKQEKKPSSNVLSYSSFFFFFNIKSENMHTSICCPLWPAEGSFLRLPALRLCPAVIYTNDFTNIELTLLRKIQLWCFNFYYSFMIYITHPISPLKSQLRINKIVIKKLQVYIFSASDQNSSHSSNDVVIEEPQHYAKQCTKAKITKKLRKENTYYFK